jgi:hypothetical protein
MRHFVETLVKITAKGIFQFKERGQPFIRTHNETLSVVAMRVCNPDRRTEAT